MIETLETMYQEAKGRLEAADSTEALEDWFRAHLGRKGEIQLMSRKWGRLIRRIARNSVAG